MRKQRIQIILPDKINNPVGGLGVQCVNMVSRLKDDFDFDIIAQPQDGYFPNYISAYNPLPEIPHSSLVTAVGQIAYFAAGLKCEKPDIVHAYDWSTYLSGVYLAKHFEVPLVVTMQLSVNLLEQIGITYAHEYSTVDGFWIHKTHCQTELLGLKQASKIIHVSKRYKDYFSSLGFDNKSIIIPNGIDLNDWSNEGGFKFPGTGKIKLVYIGRMALMKGVIALCEANIPKEIDLIFVGKSDGGEKHVFDRMIEKTKTEKNVYYLGPLFDRDKIRMLNSADAVIMPSIHEPFGIVALEALASKSVLLASFVDGMNDFLTSEIALNCGHDKDSIENTLGKLVNLKLEEKNKMIEKGLQVCREYSWDSAADKLKSVYQSLAQ